MDQLLPSDNGKGSTYGATLCELFFFCPGYANPSTDLIEQKWTKSFFVRGHNEITLLLQRTMTTVVIIAILLLQFRSCFFLVSFLPFSEVPQREKVPNLLFPLLHITAKSV
ncbi:hypothetical protein CEXT_569791 [Caerostris extrusa]|uniref:Uncharacterized protein n=1 Tax=Caerostris extrusa TaxID=172846 RepID=A0AAV4VTK5_CAEEX|nr:hypothetical protein CEXT_569791 [Caerostris extrusa]